MGTIVMQRLMRAMLTKLDRKFGIFTVDNLLSIEPGDSSERSTLTWIGIDVLESVWVLLGSTHKRFLLAFDLRRVKICILVVNRVFTSSLCLVKRIMV